MEELHESVLNDVGDDCIYLLLELVYLERFHHFEILANLSDSKERMLFEGLQRISTETHMYLLSTDLRYQNPSVSLSLLHQIQMYFQAQATELIL